MQLSVDITTHITEAHNVHTIAKIGGGNPGLAVATSRFWSGNWLTGFKAAAIITLLDENGVVLAMSDPHHGWADGTWFGNSDHTSTWTWQFDPTLAANAAAIGVIHIADENWLQNFFNFIFPLAKLTWEILRKWLEEQNWSSTSGTVAGGDLGTTDSTIWALQAEPWASYARIQQIKNMKAVAIPSSTDANVPTPITVRAADADTDVPVAGVVYIGSQAVGNTDVQFTYTWHPTYHTVIDPRTREITLRQDPLPDITVRTAGYVVAQVPFSVASLLE